MAELDCEEVNPEDADVDCVEGRPAGWEGGGAEDDMILGELVRWSHNMQ